MRFQALSLFYYLLVAVPTSVSVAGFFIAPSSPPVTHPSSSSCNKSSSVTTSNMFCLKALSTPEEYAKILTDYMARAHEEKLKALDVLEKKKNEEIAALEQQLATAKDASLSLPPAAAASSGELTLSSSSSLALEKNVAAAMEEIETLTQKVNMYQQFIADYVIKAQAEKEKAVKEAEIAFEKKYQEKLDAFLLNPSVIESTVLLQDGESADVTLLYRERNAKIALAAKAGISRWGNEELKRVGVTVLPIIKTISSPTTTVTMSTDNASQSQSVTEADHGMRADGGVGGPTLADRVMNGASVVDTYVSFSSSSSSSISSSTSLYEKRNANIAKAVSDGTSIRWGTEEVKKVMNIASNVLPASSPSSPSPSSSSPSVVAQVEAANHGMRADGGVGGPTLAERVNLGATLLKERVE